VTTEQPRSQTLKATNFNSNISFPFNTH